MGGHLPFIAPRRHVHEGVVYKCVTRYIRMKPCNLPVAHYEFNEDAVDATEIDVSCCTFYGEDSPPPASLGDVGSVYADIAGFRLYAKTAEGQWTEFSQEHYQRPTANALMHPTLGRRVALWLGKGIFMWTDGRRRWDPRPHAMGPQPVTVAEAIKRVIELGDERGESMEQNRAKRREAARRKRHADKQSSTGDKASLPPPSPEEMRQATPSLDQTTGSSEQECDYVPPRQRPATCRTGRSTDFITLVTSPSVFLHVDRGIQTQAPAEPIAPSPPVPEVYRPYSFSRAKSNPLP